jgi:hypothetical protein
LKPILNQSGSPGAAVVPCDVIAHAGVRATAADVQHLRQNFLLPSGERLPPGFLKHAEDQTVTGLAAVCQAIGNFQLAKYNFNDWGVLGAPRFLGRVAMHGAIQRFLVEGAWGISPHLIPHRLLHAVSGTVSLALKIHGPNFGVGGGPSGVSESFLAAAALLEGARLPGLWVVLTGCDPEPNTEAAGGPDRASVCNALAFALVAARPNGQGLRFRVCGAPKPSAFGTQKHAGKQLSLEALQVFVANVGASELYGSRLHYLGEGLTLEWVGGGCPFPPPKSPSFNVNGRQSCRGQIGAAAENQS